MLLFGMINWMFTWMRPDGELDYDAMAPVVADLFLGGLRGGAQAARVRRTPERPRLPLIHFSQPKNGDNSHEH